MLYKPCCVLSKATVIHLNLQCTLLVIGVLDLLCVTTLLNLPHRLLVRCTRASRTGSATFRERIGKNVKNVDTRPVSGSGWTRPWFWQRTRKRPDSGKCWRRSQMMFRDQGKTMAADLTSNLNINEIFCY